MLTGGIANDFVTNHLTGNFKPGNGKAFVYEADESDKSLLNMSPDCSVLLNLGEDHLGEQELLTMYE